MSDIEDLDTIILHQGAALPDLLIDLEDSDGDDQDLSAGYASFATKIVTEGGADAGVNGLTTSGTTTGFKVEIDAAGLGVPAGSYTIQCEARRISDNKPRRAYARLVVLTGF